MKRTGIFGGTFNPVHAGHLINLEFVRSELELDRILLIPAREPVHKTIFDKITPAERIEMVKIAIEGNPYFEASSIELDRSQSSYTLYTIKELVSLYPEDEFFLIIGSDSFNELDTWKSYAEILKSVNIAVMKRPGDPHLREDLTAISKNVFIVENPEIGISSTMIRERVKLGKSIRYLVPDPVIEYIDARGLYKN
jgi:nicotinate-nucleotide adenylyltransferase